MPQPVNMIEPGNIDLYGRPRVLNPETGEISTVRSMSFEDAKGREVLIPTVSQDGRLLSDDEAIREYFRTGQHLGVFKNATAATLYAKQLHEDYARGRYDRPGRVLTTIGGVAIAPVPSHATAK